MTSLRKLSCVLLAAGLLVATEAVHPYAMGALCGAGTTIFAGAAYMALDAYWKSQECTTHSPITGKPQLIEPLAIDAEEWTRASWYVQEQQVNSAQAENTLNCVVGTYSLEETRLLINPFTTIIDVSNYANKGGVNEEILGGYKGITLYARVTGEDGKLKVAPGFLPTFLAGPYWVAGIGKSTDAAGKEIYEWAVVIGGQAKEFPPKFPNEKGIPTVDVDKYGNPRCVTSLTANNNQGLWLFSRLPTASPEHLQAMKQRLKDIGVSEKRLKKVEQKGCKYCGAIIKDGITGKTTILENCETTVTPVDDTVDDEVDDTVADTE